MVSTHPTSPCPGCHGIFPDTDGPTHAYISASPGCWAVYGDVLAKEYGEYQYPAVHRLTVDTYAVQHPGQPSRQSIQSVAGHLISLFLVLERGLDVQKATESLRWAATQKARFTWLQPPPSLGPLTILDVARAANLAEHTRIVELWAKSVWAAWADHHETIWEWAGVQIKK
jgi:uncharacterized protein DUF5946